MTIKHCSNIASLTLMTSNDFFMDILHGFYETLYNPSLYHILTLKELENVKVNRRKLLSNSLRKRKFLVSRKMKRLWYQLNICRCHFILLKQ